MKKLLLFLCLAHLCVACAKPYLSVFYDYNSPSDLASVQVDTPDPRREAEEVGEKLFIRWALPKNDIGKDCHLQIDLLYNNYEQEQENISLEGSSGTYVFKVSPQKYAETKGLRSYKIELVVDGKVCCQWVHQLWVELIEV